MNILIRWMIRRDMPEVVAAAAETADPWSEEDFLCALRQRNVIGQIAENDDGRVLGHMLYELCDEKLVVLRLTTAWEWRKMGIGRALLRKIESKLTQGRREMAEIAVPDDNLGAHLFLRACGWTAIPLDRETYLFSRAAVEQSYMAVAPDAELSAEFLEE